MVQGFDPRGRSLSLSLSLSLACLLACQGDTSPGPRPNPKVCVSAMSGPFSGTRVRSPGCATCNQDPQNTPPSVSLSLSFSLSFFLSPGLRARPRGSSPPRFYVRKNSGTPRAELLTVDLLNVQVPRRKLLPCSRPDALHCTLRLFHEVLCSAPFNKGVTS